VNSRPMAQFSCVQNGRKWQWQHSRSEWATYARTVTVKHHTTWKSYK